MRYSAINHGDFLLSSGFLMPALPLPATPGIEGGAIVDALGPGVTRFEVGQRVLPLGILAGELGAWQEQRVVSAAHLLHQPAGVSDAQAGQFLCNGLTAVGLLDELGAGPDDWVIQSAAASAVGRIVAQLARLRGIGVVHVVRRTDHEHLLRAEGAEHVIVGEGPGLTEALRRFSGRHGPLRFAFDAVGGDTGTQLARALDPGGTLLFYGMLAREPLSLHAGDMVAKMLSLRGYYNGGWFAARSPAEREGIVGELGGHIARGEVVLPIEAEYPLSQLQAALSHSQRPGLRGKVLLRMS
jgi:NADPH:quinone reductase-like Zn-dependent oxidoreductase